MESNKLSFEHLPAAVERLLREMAEMKSLLGRLTPPNRERRLPIEIDEACGIVRKAKSTMYALVRRGLIPCYKVGKRLYFYEDELLAWIVGGQRKTIAQTKESIEAQMSVGIKHRPAARR
jgi:excisionase family DNA binding protein